MCKKFMLQESILTTVRFDWPPGSPPAMRMQVSYLQTLTKLLLNTTIPFEEEQDEW